MKTELIWHKYPEEQPPKEYDIWVAAGYEIKNNKLVPCVHYWYPNSIGGDKMQVIFWTEIINPIV